MTDRKTFSRDLLDYYFFYSSVDNKELAAAEGCTQAKDVTRTVVYVGMHKFEKIKRLRRDHKLFKEGQPIKFTDEVMLDDDDFEECVKMTILYQGDSKLNKWKQGIVKMQLPSISRDFYNNIVNFL